jgi:hypothetical protein
MFNFIAFHGSSADVRGAPPKQSASSLTPSSKQRSPGRKRSGSLVGVDAAASPHPTTTSAAKAPAAPSDPVGAAVLPPLVRDLEANLDLVLAQIRRCMLRFGRPLDFCDDGLAVTRSVDADSTAFAAGDDAAHDSGAAAGAAAAAAAARRHDHLGVEHGYVELQAQLANLLVTLTGRFATARLWVVSEDETVRRVCDWLVHPHTAGATCLLLSNCLADERCLRDLPVTTVWSGLHAGVFRAVGVRAALPPPSPADTEGCARLRQDQALVCAAAHLLRRMVVPSRWPLGSVGYQCAVLNRTELRSLLDMLEPDFLLRVAPVEQQRQRLLAQHQHQLQHQHKQHQQSSRSQLVPPTMTATTATTTVTTVTGDAAEAQARIALAEFAESIFCSSQSPKVQR